MDDLEYKLGSQHEIQLAILNELVAIRQLLEEQKTKKPKMMNDDIDGDIEKNPRESVDRSVSSAVAFAVSLEWTFKKSGNGGYDYAVANADAADWLSRNSPSKRSQLLAMAESHHSSLIERLIVKPGMFDALWDLVNR